MKMFFELLYGITFGWLFYLTAKSDFNEGKVYNKHIVIFACIGLMLDTIYYGTVGRGMAWGFISNLIVVIVIALCLFFSHSFAGGDAKLLFVLAIVYPADFYLTYNGNSLTLYIAVMLAILYGYIYLIICSVYELLKGTSKMTGAYIVGYIMKFAGSFIVALVYIGILNIIFLIITTHGVAIDNWIYRVISLIVAYLVNNKKIFKKWYLLGPATLLLLFMIVHFGTVPYSYEIGNYILIILILLCQMTAKTSLYETVKISQLHDGMILSVASSLMLQNSRVRGLPQISSEDLRSRLTQDEVESVKLWAKNRKIEQLVIVRKIPFAFFLLIGFASYYVIWRILR